MLDVVNKAKVIAVAKIVVRFFMLAPIYVVYLTNDGAIRMGTVLENHNAVETIFTMDGGWIFCSLLGSFDLSLAH